MIRRTLLRQLAWTAAGLAAGSALADPVDDITREIRDQGFSIVRVQRTWLGRVRIIAQNASFRREVVIDPTTGEIRRDLLIPRKGGPAKSPAAKPELGTSRGIGTIEEEAGEGGGDANWGGGWGSQGTPDEGAGDKRKDDADAR